MKAIVTGGAGLIGCHLVKKLLEEGREVVVVDDLSRGNPQNLRDLGADVPLISADLRDPREAYEALRGADVVFHLAARVGSVEFLHGTKRAELEALWSNLAIDINVIRACLEHGVRKLIYASSVSVYPIDTQGMEGVVLSEDDFTLYPSLGRVNPEGGYGWAKLLGEIQLCWMDGIDIGIARIFNVYGEGEDLGKTAHVVPALIRKAILYPKEEFIVWGDGAQTRDFLYVSDCVEALLKLEEKASMPPIIVNIGSDTPVPIKVLAEKIVEISGKEIEIKFDPSRPVGPRSRTANIRRAKEILGWKPRISLEEGLIRTYKWAERRLLK